MNHIQSHKRITDVIDEMNPLVTPKDLPQGNHIKVMTQEPAVLRRPMLVFFLVQLRPLNMLRI